MGAFSLNAIESPAKRFNTEHEEAARLGISVRTLQSWRAKGTGPAYLKLGRAVRYQPEVTDAWLQSRQRRSTADTGE
jgi:predicted DNA-binding transcriptional regulator AlpA